MTNELFSDYIKSELQEIYSDNTQMLLKQLIELAPSKCDPETLKLVMYAMNISSQISVQYVLRALENAGVISLPADGAPILSVHKN